MVLAITWGRNCVGVVDGTAAGEVKPGALLVVWVGAALVVSCGTGTGSRNDGDLG